jgi:tRNA threonylcarbamoyladenosine biosynthesis protein TsaB
MRILAIETSGRLGSAAALEADGASWKLLAEKRLTGSDGRTAQALAPALVALLAEVGWTPKSIELIAVPVGPGSFTGLRIGVTTAKILAYAVGAEVIGVNTLDVLAEQSPRSTASLWTILDAQRQELFVARFSAAPSGAEASFRRTDDTAILPIEDWLARLQEGDGVTGPALKKLAARLPRGVILLPEDCWEPTAAAVGRLAWRAYQGGHRDDAWKLMPAYYRPSAAEEKAAASKGHPSI